MAGYVELPLFVAPESHPTCALPPRYSTKSRLRHCTSGVSGQRDNLQENVKNSIILCSRLTVHLDR
jgi:hypothetical protein